MGNIHQVFLSIEDSIFAARGIQARRRDTAPHPSPRCQQLELDKSSTIPTLFKRLIRE
jgi:hypothetical protein